MAITARFRVVNKTLSGGYEDIELRATRQGDAANSENPVLWEDDKSQANQIQLRIKRSQAVGTFFKGKDVVVTFS